MKRGDVQFKVGDLVLAHLRKERLQKGKYIKFLMKKIGPCRVVHKFWANSYEMELLLGVAISFIFNIDYLYPFKGSMDESMGVDANVVDEDLFKYLPPSEPLKLEFILDIRESKRTRNKVYHEYLVKWQGLLMEDATWMSEEDIKMHVTIF